VLDTLFHALIRYAAPVLVFTSEEVWGTRYPEGGSVHLLEWPDLTSLRHSRESGNPATSDGSWTPDQVRGDELKGKWAKLRSLRQQVTEAIEPLRRDKVVGSSLEAEVTVQAVAVPDGVGDEELAELFISATVGRSDDPAVTVRKSDDAKCGRCWRLLPEVPEDGGLCARCEDVVAQLDTAA
jgi:isoleucyl-tRNA synthetase